jgi:hypothetical protein
MNYPSGTEDKSFRKCGDLALQKLAFFGGKAAALLGRFDTAFGLPLFSPV